jgi:tRNA (cytidine32/uridine32-2'-O)-methyltransferase
MQKLLTNIRIVLVKTSHPGNIGAAARAMKTMGLSRLYLVNPKHFPDRAADERAAHAGDILEQAVVVDTFLEAIQDCQMVFGTSVRLRDVQGAYLNARDAGVAAIKTADHSQVAIVFGSERTGLLNEELQHCQYQVEIPANPHYNSLNLASAVQVLCYELWMAANAQQPAIKIDDEFPLATVSELEHLYQHWEKVLCQVEFLNARRSNQVMLRLRHLFNRAHLDEREVKILRGILKAIEKN